MILDSERVKLFLPHRDPFLFVDSIDDIVIPGREEDIKNGVVLSPKELVGGHVIGKYRTRADHSIFAGHFPGNPILPGVVQVEMMAQISSFILLRAYPDAFNMNMEVALLGVDNSKFKKPVLPETDLTIKAVCTKVRGSFMAYDCECYSGDELVSQASILATLKFD